MVGYHLNGTPIYCSGLDYSHATNEFCLKDYRYSKEAEKVNDKFQYLKDGKLSFNIERIMGLTVRDIPDPRTKGKKVERSFVQYGKLWYVGNHGKYGISSPRDSKSKKQKKYVIFGDMNGGGFPAAKICQANQFSRGGLFFMIQNDELWDSLEDMVDLVCSCNESAGKTSNFCGWGGKPTITSEDGKTEPTYGRVDSWDAFAQMPQGKNEGSFWSGKKNNDGRNKAWVRYNENGNAAK